MGWRLPEQGVCPWTPLKTLPTDPQYWLTFCAGHVCCIPLNKTLALQHCSQVLKCYNQGSNYRRGCRGFPRHWSSVSPALLWLKASQPGMLFIPGTAFAIRKPNPSESSRTFWINDFIIWIKDRPKTGFTFSAENENGAENELSFLARNRNENESWLSFSAENENKYFK